MYFLIKNDDLLEKYNTIWEKVSVDIRKGFDSKAVYNKKFLKTKKVLMVIQLQTFMIKNPKVDSNHTCSAVISLDSPLKKDDNYYLQVFLRVYYSLGKVIGRIKDNLSDFLLLMSLMKNKFRWIQPVIFKRKRDEKHKFS